MKKLLVLASLMVCSSSAFALNGYISRSMSCAHLRYLTRTQGEITVLHRIGNMTYYADKARCSEFPYPAEARPGYEPSRDSNSCFVGWECVFHGGGDDI